MTTYRALLNGHEVTARKVSGVWLIGGDKVSKGDNVLIRLEKNGRPAWFKLMGCFLKFDDFIPRAFSPQNLVSQVGSVDTVVFSGDFTERHQLFEGSVGAGLVIQSQAEATGAGFHPGAGCVLHDFQLIGGSRPRRPSHNADTHCAMGYLRVYVRG